VKELLQSLLKATNTPYGAPYAQLDGMHFTYWPDTTVLNFQGRDRDLTRVDVDWVRAVLADLGYDITDEWLPVQGQSWLSRGVSAGVSFRLAVRS
jgi:hypothetical protein